MNNLKEESDTLPALIDEILQKHPDMLLDNFKFLLRRVKALWQAKLFGCTEINTLLLTIGNFADSLPTEETNKFAYRLKIRLMYVTMIAWSYQSSLEKATLEEANKEIGKKLEQVIKWGGLKDPDP